MENNEAKTLLRSAILFHMLSKMAILLKRLGLEKTLVKTQRWRTGFAKLEWQNKENYNVYLRNIFVADGRQYSTGGDLYTF